MRESAGRNRLLTIFLIVFVDLLGFSLILPLLPYYAEQYGASEVTVGLLTASYAAAQLVGAPLLGRLSDQHGRRPILLISIAGTAFGFLLLGMAEVLGQSIGVAFFGANLAAINIVVLTLLFISRILDGLTGGNISVAQAYIADVTPAEERGKAFGLIGAAFGLGFIIGPVVGGVLGARFGYAVPAFVAMTIATLNLVAVYLFLPESVTPEQRAAMTNRPRPAFNIGSLREALQRPRVGPLFHVRFFFGMAFAMFQSIFALYAAGDPLNLSIEQTGLVLGYVGVLSVVIQGFAIGRLTKRYSDKQLMLVSAMLMAGSLLLWGFVPNVWTLLIVMAPLAFGGGVLNTVINSALSKSVYPEEIGGTLGISASLESLTRVIAPALGGLLLAVARPWGPALFSSVLMVWVASFIWRRLFINPDPPLEPRSEAPGRPYAKTPDAAIAH
ncbi:MFS transporter [Caldilinea sp.]|uniref:MFS transporter n=1 Tax=Caldilinea sp. TaxID=2293560 RepID=UPI002CC802C5|nr:MFS transporter [Caldilinea sp.]HRA65769.1 MFS transporter [Caldilinea sp.]